MAVTQEGGGREPSPSSSRQGAPWPWGCCGAGQDPAAPACFPGGRRCPGPPQTAGCGLWFAGSSDTARLRFPKRSLTTAGSSQSAPRLPAHCPSQGWRTQQSHSYCRALLPPSPLLWGAGRGPWVQHSPLTGRESCWGLLTEGEPAEQQQILSE